MADPVLLRPIRLTAIVADLAGAIAPSERVEMVRRLRFAEVLFFEVDQNSGVGLLLSAVRRRVQRAVAGVDGGKDAG